MSACASFLHAPQAVNGIPNLEQSTRSARAVVPFCLFAHLCQQQIRTMRLTFDGHLICSSTPGVCFWGGDRVLVSMAGDCLWPGLVFVVLSELCSGLRPQRSPMLSQRWLSQNRRIVSGTRPSSPLFAVQRQVLHCLRLAPSTSRLLNLNPIPK